MSYLQPNPNKGIIDESGGMLKGFRQWAQNVTRRQLFRGEGSPEGVLEAVGDALYADENTNFIYWKKYDEIAGDSSKGWVNASGGGYISVTAEYTMTVDDYLAECSGGPYTVYLPTAVGLEGRQYAIKNIEAGLITVDPDGTETIDGSLTKILSQWDGMQIMSNGSSWIII